MDSRVPLPDALRKCVVLGGQTGSSALRDWANRELRGYGIEAALPPYRVLPAIICVDFRQSTSQITGQRLSPQQLPDFAHNTITEDVSFREGVAELVAMADKAGDGAVKLSLPSGADLMRYMNAQAGAPYQHIDSIYWSVSGVAVRGAVDQISTVLTGLVEEIRAALPPDQVVPTAAAADQAIQVVLHDAKRARVTVTNAQASGGGRSNISAAPNPGLSNGSWSLGRRIGAAVVGVAGVVAAGVALADWQSWNPF